MPYIELAVWYREVLAAKMYLTFLVSCYVFPSLDLNGLWSPFALQTDKIKSKEWLRIRYFRQ